MATLPEQLTAAGKTQLATQIEFFQKLSAQAFDSAERMLALNLSASRSTIEQSSAAVRQLMTVRDPRDLLALGMQTRQHTDAVMAYSRQLFEIASSVAVPPLAAAAAPAPAARDDSFATAHPIHVAEEAAPVAAPVHQAAGAHLPSKHPMGEADPAPTPAMQAKPTAIAAAASEVAEAPVDTPHPAASPVPASGPIDIPPMTPVEAAAPPAARSNGAAPRTKKSDGAQGAKGSRKR